MSSRIRDIENHVESNSCFQPRGLLPEITSETAQALGAQRHTLVQEAFAEVIRSDATMPIHFPS